jgi:hypothetical protein
MHPNEYLFPRRLSRRDFLARTGLAAGALAWHGSSQANDSQPPVRLGGGSSTYELIEGWGDLPPGLKYGFGCAVVVDSQDRVFVTSRSTNPAVAIFDRDGKLLETWSQDFATKIGYTVDQVAQTAHGLYWSKEGSREYLYWTENAPGCRVIKTDLHGKVLFQMGKVAAESSAARPFKFDNPTDVAVAANGDVYVVDGYGSQLVHRFSKDFTLIKTIGGPGKEHGKFKTCHGVWIHTLGAEPEVYIADRHNDRIEVFSLDLEYKRTVQGDVRNPCCFYQQQGLLFIPDLASRVTILDAKDRLVAHLGDGKDVPGKEKNPATFAAPHALCVDSRGDLYVIEWVDFGRPRKFRRV